MGLECQCKFIPTLHVTIQIPYFSKFNRLFKLRMEYTQKIKSIRRLRLKVSLKCQTLGIMTKEGKSLQMSKKNRLTVLLSRQQNFRSVGNVFDILRLSFCSWYEDYMTGTLNYGHVFFTCHTFHMLIVRQTYSPSDNVRAFYIFGIHSYVCVMPVPNEYFRFFQCTTVLK